MKVKVEKKGKKFKKINSPKKRLIVIQCWFRESQKLDEKI
jgi:hypothetical protein